MALEFLSTIKRQVENTISEVNKAATVSPSVAAVKESAQQLGGTDYAKQLKKLVTQPLQIPKVELAPIKPPTTTAPKTYAAGPQKAFTQEANKLPNLLTEKLQNFNNLPFYEQESVKAAIKDYDRQQQSLIGNKSTMSEVAPETMIAINQELAELQSLYPKATKEQLSQFRQERGAVESEFKKQPALGQALVTGTAHPLDASVIFSAIKQYAGQAITPQNLPKIKQETAKLLALTAVGYSTYGLSNIPLSYLSDDIRRFEELDKLPGLKLPQGTPLLGGAEIKLHDFVRGLSYMKGASILEKQVVSKAAPLLAKIANPVLKNLARLGVFIASQAVYDAPIGFLEKPRPGLTRTENAAFEAVAGVGAATFFKTAGKGIEFSNSGAKNFMEGRKIGQNILGNMKDADVQYKGETLMDVVVNSNFNFAKKLGIMSNMAVEILPKIETIRGVVDQMSGKVPASAVSQTGFLYAGQNADNGTKFELEGAMRKIEQDIQDLDGKLSKDKMLTDLIVDADNRLLDTEKIVFHEQTKRLELRSELNKTQSDFDTKIEALNKERAMLLGEFGNLEKPGIEKTRQYKITDKKFKMIGLEIDELINKRDIAVRELKGQLYPLEHNKQFLDNKLIEGQKRQGMINREGSDIVNESFNNQIKDTENEVLDLRDKNQSFNKSKQVIESKLQEKLWTAQDKINEISRHRSEVINKINLYESDKLKLSKKDYLALLDNESALVRERISIEDQKDTFKKQAKNELRKLDSKIEINRNNIKDLDKNRDDLLRKLYSPERDTPEFVEIKRNRRKLQTQLDLLKSPDTPISEKLEILKQHGFDTKIQSELESLAKEAQKYKSAEEFIAKVRGSATQYGDYNPELRLAGASPNAKRLTDLGIDPNKKITIYRGIDDVTGKLTKKINDGDFVTTNYDSALAYTGNPKNVVSMNVKAKDLFSEDADEFVRDPFYVGSEYIYSTKAGAQLNDKQLTDIYNQATSKSLQTDPLIAEAKKTGINYDGDYPGESLGYDFKSGGGIEFQNTDKAIVIRGVGNGGSIGSGEATKFVKSLIEYADKTGKDVVISGVSNQSYWQHLGFKDINDFKYKVDNANIKSQLIDLWNQSTKSSQLDPLLKEARKYKSAEEFVEGQPRNKLGLISLDESYGKKLLGDTNDTVKVYRGGGQGELRLGDYITTDKSRASQYGKVQEFEIPKNQLRISDEEGIKLGLHTKNDLIFDNRSQLTDLWNQSNKASDISPNSKLNETEFLDQVPRDTRPLTPKEIKEFEDYEVRLREAKLGTGVDSSGKTPTEQVFRKDKFALPEKLANELDEFRKEIGLGNRRIRSKQDVELLAQELGANPKKLVDDIENGRIVDSEVKALRNLINQQSRDINTLEERLVKPIDPIEKQELERQIASIYHNQKLALKKLVKGGTEAGRAVAAYRYQASQSMDPFVWKNKAYRILGDENFNGNISKQIDDILLNKDLITEEKQLMLARFMAGLEQPGVLQKLITLWKAGLLTGVGTHATNMIGNIGMGSLERFTKTISVPIDKAMAIITDQRTQAFPSLESYQSGALRGWKDMKDMIKNGVTADDFKKWEIRIEIDYGPNLPGRILTASTRTVFRVLGAEDKIFFAVSLQNSLSEQASVLAMNAGKDGLKIPKLDKVLKGDELAKYLYKNPTDGMIAESIMKAEYDTFQGKNVFEQTISGGKRAAESLPGGKIAGAVIDVATPFRRTPSNVALRVIDFSPVGGLKALKNIGDALYQTATGKPFKEALGSVQKEFTQNVARSLTGTGIMYLGAYLYQKGIMTGAYPSHDSQQQKIWDAKGIKPNSLKIGDTWYGLDRISPVGNLLSLGADFAKREDEPMIDRLKSTTLDGWKVFKEQSFIKGLNDMISVLNEPEVNGDYMLNSLSGSLVPAIIGRITRALDPNKKEITSPVDAFLSRIPVLSRDIQTKHNMFGQEMKFDEDTLQTLVLPTSVKIEKNDPHLVELKRLVDLGYDVMPSAAEIKQSVNVKQVDRSLLNADQIKEIEAGLKKNPLASSVNITLTAKQVNDLRKLQGQAIEKAFKTMISMKEYEELTNDQRALELRKKIDQKKTTLKQQFFRYKEKEKKL